MQAFFRYSFFIILISSASSVFAKPPLLQAHHIQALIGQKSIVFLDLQEAAYYQRFHIPGAVNAPYSHWRTGKNSPQKGMLPPLNSVAKWVGELGISNDSHVVVYATGTSAGDMAAAARVYWTFQVLGHDAVSILDGGLLAYANQDGTLEQTINKRPATTFKSQPRKHLQAGKTDVHKSIKSGKSLIDARSVAEYLGVYQASPEEQVGTIPGSKNLPFDWLTMNGSGQLLEVGQLKELFKQRGISGNDGIHYCHTGNRASLSWFVDYALLNNKSARLYDASTQEWARDSKAPMETEISLH